MCSHHRLDPGNSLPRMDWPSLFLVCYLLLCISLPIAFGALHEIYEALIKDLPGDEIRRLAGLIGLEDASVGFLGLGSLRETLTWSMSDATKQPVLLAEFEEILHGSRQWKCPPQALPPPSATTSSSAIDLGTMTALSKICFPRQQSAMMETLRGTLEFPPGGKHMALRHLAAKPGVRRIFDIGPAWTHGSTQALSDGLGSSGGLGCTSNITHHCCDKFVAAFEMQGAVWDNYRDDPVWFVPGTTVGEEFLVKFKPFDTPRVHVQEGSSSNPDDLEYERAKALVRSKKPVLQDLCKVARPEVVLIGGSDFTAWGEFLVVVQWCRPRWIALQDVGTRRTAKIEEYINGQPEKFALVQEELGLAVYEISDSHIFAPGESNSGFREFQRSILMQRPRWLSLYEVGTPEMAQIEGFVRDNPEIFAFVEHYAMQDRSVFEVFGTLLWGIESTQGGEALRAQSLEMIHKLLLSPLPYLCDSTARVGGLGNDGTGFGNYLLCLDSGLFDEFDLVDAKHTSTDDDDDDDDDGNLPDSTRPAKEISDHGREQGRQGSLVSIGVSCYDELDNKFERVMAAEHGYKAVAFGIDDCPASPANDVSFWRLELGGSDDLQPQTGRTPKTTLRSALDKANVSTVDLLKVDCEGCEWHVFRQLRDDDPLLLADLGVSVIMLEIHFFNELRGPSQDNVSAFVQLMDSLGFDMYWRDVNLGSVSSNMTWYSEALSVNRRGAAEWGYLDWRASSEHGAVYKCCIEVGFIRRKSGPSGTL